MMLKRKFLATIAYLLGVHLLALTVMTAFRLVQYLVLGNMIGDGDACHLTAFVKGVWFDNVIACYVMVVPLVVLSLLGVLGIYRRWLLRAANIWFILFYALVLMASAGNIPYFAYFFKNLDSSIFGWMGYAGTTAGMVFGETAYLPYILAWVVSVVLFVWLLRRWRRIVWHRIEEAPREPLSWLGCAWKLIVAALLIFGCLFGIRGRRGYNPIKISQAYYCDDPFLNQLGINPTFNLLTSFLDDLREENRELHLMPYAEAVGKSRAYLGLTGAVDSTAVLHRHIEADTTEQHPNIVMILMESMSAGFMQSLDATESFAPVLDSLYQQSLAFTRFYSAGIHTNHGITATLYSYPALMFRNLMKGTVTPRRSGLPTILKGEGYHNLFFMTHEAQYDNMNAFLRTNGYDEVYAQENYPKEERVNAFGVPDHYLFTYALSVINERAQSGNPFFATLLTISNHPPYIIPDWFHPRTSDPETQIVEYADRCIGDFLSAARQQPWYDNTLFVILADHGKLVGKTEAELPQSYNHIPLIIFGPGVEPGIYDGLGTQVDVTPTLLGLLGVSYDFDGFGQDLLRTPREQVFYTSDTQVVGRDSSACFIYNHQADKYFYYNVDARGALTPTQASSHFDALKDYAFSMVQTAEYLYRRQK